MPVTYTVTEQDGFTHTRTSAGHTAPVYTHAVVREPHCGKSGVSYCSRLDLAQAALAAVLKPRHYAEEKKGQPRYPDACILPVTAAVR